MTERNQPEERDAFACAVGELNQALLDAEEALASMRDKVETSVALDEVWDPESGYSYTTNLIFAKLGSEWRLGYYVYEDGEDPEGVRTIPLTSASLKIRLAAAGALDELLESVRKRRAERVAEIQGAAGVARAFALRVHGEEIARG